MISMSVGISPPRDRSYDSIVVGHSGQLKLRCILEARARGASAASASRGQFMRQIVFSHDFQRLFEDFP